jgi:hypothetical protein
MGSPIRARIVGRRVARGKAVLDLIVDTAVGLPTLFARDFLVHTASRDPTAFCTAIA